MRPLNTRFLLQQLVVDQAFVERNYYLVGSEQPENDIEHSFSVSLLCWYINASNSTALDIAKILKYALPHDLV